MTARSTRRPLYTIGHSTRTYAELLAALRAWQVTTLVDIRRFTHSRTNPQFNERSLGEHLREDGIRYLVLPALGGRRTKSRIAKQSRNAGWQNTSFRNYADYADTKPFVEGLATLLTLVSRSTCAVMCSEALWWRCHRRIVADHVIAHGTPVVHIFSDTNAQPATLTAFARIDREHMTVSYPPPPSNHPRHSASISATDTRQRTGRTRPGTSDALHDPRGDSSHGYLLLKRLEETGRLGDDA